MTTCDLLNTIKKNINFSKEMLGYIYRGNLFLSTNNFNYNDFS